MRLKARYLVGIAVLAIGCIFAASHFGKPDQVAPTYGLIAPHNLGTDGGILWDIDFTHERKFITIASHNKAFPPTIPSGFSDLRRGIDLSGNKRGLRLAGMGSYRPGWRKADLKNDSRI